jgi:hypothetical protein
MNDNGRERRSYWWRAIFGSNYTFASICECGNVKCLIKLFANECVGKADLGGLLLLTLCVICDCFKLKFVDLVRRFLHRRSLQSIAREV